METPSKPLQVAFTSHPRNWRDYTYVYPVISRRSKGLSVGVNLNPDTACNFDCIYCQVDRTRPPRVRTVDLAVVRSELSSLIEQRDALFDEPEFARIEPPYRRLNDIAFSGDGEPTASLVFPEAARLAAEVLERHRLPDVKIVVITDACFLTRPKVAETLSFLDHHNGEVWAKLDAGTEEYFRRVNVPSHSLQHVMENILATARLRPVVIQSLFMRIEGEPPPLAEIAAYVERLRWVQESGGRVALVQVYTVARRPAQSYVSRLTAEELDHIGQAVRAAGIPVETYP